MSRIVITRQLIVGLRYIYISSLFCCFIEIQETHTGLSGIVFPSKDIKWLELPHDEISLHESLNSILEYFHKVKVKLSLCFR
jgi:hypothetical protein